MRQSIDLNLEIEDIDKVLCTELSLTPTDLPELVRTNSGDTSSTEG
jgi:hypothetical protein